MSTIFHLFSKSDYSVKVPEGEVIYATGTLAEEMYFVLEGEVNIIVADKVFETISEGGIFGEVAMLDNGVHGADAVAKSPCIIASISRSRFKMMVEETPFFAMDVMKSMAERMHARLAN